MVKTNSKESLSQEMDYSFLCKGFFVFLCLSTNRITKNLLDDGLRIRKVQTNKELVVILI